MIKYKLSAYKAHKVILKSLLKEKINKLASANEYSVCSGVPTGVVYKFAVDLGYPFQEDLERVLKDHDAEIEE
jgi:hypothetical protein